MKLIYINNYLFYAKSFCIKCVSLQGYDPTNPLTLKQVGVVWRVIASNGCNRVVLAERNTKEEADKILSDIYHSRKKKLTFKEDPTLWKSVQLAEVK